MASSAYATLVNLVGFVTGGVLYGMLLVMVLRGQAGRYALGAGQDHSRPASDRLPLATALLGLGWNLIGGVAYGLPELGLASAFPILLALAFVALGFLPAVVVHSVIRTAGPLSKRRGPNLIVLGAYALSAATGLVELYNTIKKNVAPSHSALVALTMGFVVLTVMLLILTRKEAGWRRAIWVVALSLFSVSALHLSHHVGENYPWWIELAGHHASLPLVLAILYQDYRFALADIFLKRALALVLLVSLAFGLYVVVIQILAPARATAELNDPRQVGLLLAMWVATALIYPLLRRAADQFVDRVVLRRADYDKLKIEIASQIADHENPATTLDFVCEHLAPALTAAEIRWITLDEEPGPPESVIQHNHGANGFPLSAPAPTPLGDRQAASASRSGMNLFKDIKPGSDSRAGLGSSNGTTGSVLVPTVDPPQYLLIIGELAGGRRLLSDDIAMLESAAIMAARRIDGIRVMHERYERDVREHEISKLATEADLRALRAQMNPHFLFNALTTIGYLIQTSPNRALDALMRLTGLLRGALQRSAGEFATLDQEMEVIESYLEIERARFEERLRIRIDVQASERLLRIPCLLVQPLVENAVKHGIGPCRAGGEITVIARRIDSKLHISVEDSGAGVDTAELALRRKEGFGLTNVEQRLRCYYGDEASFRITSQRGVGTSVDIILPVVHQTIETGELIPADTRVRHGMDS